LTHRQDGSDGGLRAALGDAADPVVPGEER
jgi:hypothetical protein